MNFARKIALKKTLSALDFGAEKTLVFIAEKTDKGIWRLLGGGEAPSRGMEGEELVCVSDAVESVVEALRKAERSSGLRVTTLYFNFDDIGLESLRVKGSKNLSGEGQIKKPDVEEVKAIAERLAGHFEKTPVYSREMGYLIDGRDAVMNPLGVFGSRLEVTLHLLMARSEYCERWRKVIERAPIRYGMPVLSSLSTVYGILPAADRQKKRLIWDLGKDFLNGLVYDQNRICRARICRSPNEKAEVARQITGLSQVFFDEEPGLEEILITGDWSEDGGVEAVLKESFAIPVRIASPWGVEKLDKPSHASAAGLLRAADELERKTHASLQGQDMFMDWKERAAAFLSDYF